MHSKIVFGVTDHFCIKWQFDPLDSTGQRRCQETFFLGGNFTQIFEAKKLSTFEQKCPGHFDSSQFSPKSAVF